MRRQNTKRVEKPLVVNYDQLSSESRAFKRATQVLDKAIREKLEEKPRPRGTLMPIIAEEQFAAIETLIPLWKYRMLQRAIGSVERKMRKEDRAEQYPLPGFDCIPLRLEIGEKQPRLSAATEPTILEYLAQEEAKRRVDTPRITQLRALAKLMKKYTPTEPEITVREVFEREAART